METTFIVANRTENLEEFSKKIQDYFLKHLGGEIINSDVFIFQNTTEKAFILNNGKFSLQYSDYVNITAEFIFTDLGSGCFNISLSVQKATSGTYWMYFALGTFFWIVFWPMLYLRYISIDSDKLYKDTFENCQKELKLIEKQIFDEKTRFEHQKEESSKEIAVDKNSIHALQQRADACIGLGDYETARVDISKAIELNSNDSENYRIRRNIDFHNGDWKRYMEDSLLFNKTRENPNQYQIGENDDPFIKILLKNINKHFTEIILPQIFSNKENLIDSWIAPLILWERDTRQVLYDGYSHFEEIGNIGSGYICLTDLNFRIITIGDCAVELGKAIKDDKKGFLPFVFSVLKNSSNNTRVDENDNIWLIPNNTIISAMITKDRLFDISVLKVYNPVTSWEIMANDIELITNILNLSHSNQNQISFHSEEKASSHQLEMISLIKELSVLRENNAISEAEFEEKKKELLSRI